MNDHLNTDPNYSGNWESGEPPYPESHFAGEGMSGEPPYPESHFAGEGMSGGTWVSSGPGPSGQEPGNREPEKRDTNPGQNSSTGSGYYPNGIPRQQAGPQYAAPPDQNNPGRGWGAPTSRQENQPGHQYSTANGWQQLSDGAPQWNGPTGPNEPLPPKKKKRRIGAVVGAMVGGVLAITLVVLAGFGAYNLVSGNLQAVPQDTSSESTSSGGQENFSGIALEDVPRSTASSSVNGKLSSEEVVDKVLPSVVAVTTYADFRNFQPYSIGSGIIIREDGYIVTNAHVVEGAKGISVQMNDGDVKEARLVAADTKTDLAVLKMEGSGYPTAVFGNSTQVKVGEKVLAIGNPQSMEFYGSVTQGIVSGLNRRIQASSAGGGGVTNYVDLIQTDAAINPGNSGGALVNEYGQVIGVNSAKVIAEGAEGMGFAIPANDVKRIVDDLIQYQRVTGRARLGVTVQEVNQVYASYLGSPTGLGVMSTEPDSDISKKGVAPGDIITKVDGNTIASMADLSDVIDNKKPGDSVDLEIYRFPTRSGQKARTFNVTVVLMEDMGAPVTQNTQDQQTTPDFGGNFPGYGSGENGSGGNGSGGNGSQYPSEDELQDFFSQFFN